MLISDKLLFDFGGEKETYKQGDTIVKKGKYAKFYFQILDGKAIRNNFFQEKIILKSMLVKGQSLGEAFLFTNNSYSITIQAIEDCQIIQLEKSKFFALLEKHPHLYSILCKCMSEKLIQKFNLIHTLSTNKNRSFQ